MMHLALLTAYGVCLLGASSVFGAVVPSGLTPNGTTVSLHTEVQKAFLALSRQERREVYTNKEYRATLAGDRSGAPKPVTLGWAGDGPATVTVSRSAGGRPVFTATVTGTAVAVSNLEMNASYVWTVANAAGSAVGTFSTEDLAPRLLRDPNPARYADEDVGGALVARIHGVRDLGGRLGLDGRRVRQGRIIRTSQFNDASGSFINDTNRGFWRDELGIRTDLDLRKAKELADITASPLGPDVKFVNCAIGRYENFFDKSHTDAFGKAFAVLLDEANYPVAVHCLDGQDRAGIYAFVVNALLGVDEEELLKDWEATAFWNTAGFFRHDTLIDMFLADLAAKFPAATVQEQAYAFIRSLGFTAAQVTAFRELMLEPASVRPEEWTVSATPGVDFCGSTVVLGLNDGFDAGGETVTGELTIAGRAQSVAGTVDLEAKTVTFAIGPALITAGETRSATIAVAVGDETFRREVTLKQGLVVSETSDGWIRERAAAIGATGAWSARPTAEGGAMAVAGPTEFTPSVAAPEGAKVVVKAHLALGDESIGAPAGMQASVWTVNTAAGCRYAFRTADGAVTNFETVAESGAEVDLAVVLDYAAREVSYVVGAVTNGPFALAGSATRMEAVRFDGEGRVDSLDGDYARESFSTNVARVGATDYPTVAAALAAGAGPVQLVWDASWAPTKGGSAAFVDNGHRLVVRGDAAAHLTRDAAGNLIVRVVTAEDVRPVEVKLAGDSVSIGVRDAQVGFRYGVKRAAALGGDDAFAVDESSWVSGAELRAGKSIEVRKTPEASGEFFKVVVDAEQ